MGSRATPSKEPMCGVPQPSARKAGPPQINNIQPRKCQSPHDYKIPSFIKAWIPNFQILTSSLLVTRWKEGEKAGGRGRGRREGEEGGEEAGRDQEGCRKQAERKGGKHSSHGKNLPSSFHRWG